MAQSLEDLDQAPGFAKKKEYERALELAQLRMLLIQRYLHASGSSEGPVAPSADAAGKRAVIVIEGRDACGKGGAITRLVQRLDPRGYAVHPIGPPDPWDTGHHHLERFFERLPRPRAIAIFDRSWYGRVLVERVEGLCPESAWKRAFDEINEFEKWLVDDGVPIVKFLLHVSKEEQLRRFEERRDNPFKSWKLTDADWRARAKWDEYAAAFNEMLSKTDTARAQWHVFASDHKWKARVDVIETAAASLGQFFGVSLELPKGWRIRKNGDKG